MFAGALFDFYKKRHKRRIEPKQDNTCWWITQHKRHVLVRIGSGRNGALPEEVFIATVSLLYSFELVGAHHAFYVFAHIFFINISFDVILCRIVVADCLQDHLQRTHRTINNH